MYSEVVQSVNIMIAILLVAVGIAIYYIFMYDTWYPNEQGEDSYPRNEDRTLSGEAEGAH
jgi:flagellar basal body-associated protein FliL